MITIVHRLDASPEPSIGRTQFAYPRYRPPLRMHRSTSSFVGKKPRALSELLVSIPEWLVPTLPPPCRTPTNSHPYPLSHVVSSLPSFLSQFVTAVPSINMLHPLK
ncbi:hypothetical protein L1887_33256 [Cichorium endivia]|nr:hypothetical protein L1887_33256 [Cichorium endivia]